MSFYFEENAWGERFIPDVNRDLFMHARSSEVYDQQLELDLHAKNTLHLVVGSDSGLLVKYLADNLTGEGSCAVVIEHDELYSVVEEECRTLLSTVESEDSEVARVLLSSASEWLGIVSTLRYNAWFLGGSVNLTQASCCETDYDNRYFSVIRDSGLAVTEHRIKLKQALGNQRFLEMQMLNAADNINPCPVSTEFGKEGRCLVYRQGKQPCQFVRCDKTCFRQAFCGW